MDKDYLNQEYNKALSCYERALFYATSIHDGDIIKLEYYALGYSVAKPGRSVSRVEDGSSVPLLIALSIEINSIYIAAQDLLTTRLTDVTTKYFVLQNALGSMNKWRFWLSKELKAASWSDRDNQAVIISKNVVLENYEHILHRIEGFLDPYIVESMSRREGTAQEPHVWDEEEIIRTITQLIGHWAALHSVSSLLMNEITYLSKRVDDMNAVLNTKRSIRNATFGIGVSIIISLASLWTNLKNSAGSEMRGNQLNQELAQWNVRSSDIQKAIDANNQNVMKEMGALQQTVSNMERLMTMSKVPPSLQPLQDAIDRLKTAIENHKGSVSTIQSSP